MTKARSWLRRTYDRSFWLLINYYGTKARLSKLAFINYPNNILEIKASFQTCFES